MSDYTDEEFRDLQERSALIEEMADHPGWALLCDRAYKMIGPRQQRVLKGNLPDYLAYQKEICFIDGASFILRLPAVVKEELEKELQLRQTMIELEEEEAA